MSGRFPARAWAVGLASLALLAATGLLAPRPGLAAAAAPASSEQGMVVTSSPYATLAGVEMLERGGNAVDAAVAATFASAVTEPASSGLGGGCFVLIRTPGGEVIALDARETAPAAASRDMYLADGLPEKPSLHGPLAVATPGEVAGLALALEKWGTLPLADVLAPAIRLAEDGFPVGPRRVAGMARIRKWLKAKRFPETSRIQWPPGDDPISPGWRLLQKDLAKTLRAIADAGPSAFYQGPIAEAIARTVQEKGGLLTREDLAGYRPVVREPIRGSYRETDVYSFPPPSSGGLILVEILNILEGFDLAAAGAGSSAANHLIAEAMKLAFADRAAYLGDPDFVQVPAKRIASKEYAEAQRARIDPEKAITVKGPGFPIEDYGTTHLSVTDAKGGAVAITATINTPYGSGITVPGTGIILNNEMDDFSKQTNDPNVYGLVDTLGFNSIAAKKRPLSSMAPTILVRGGKVFMVTGSPGGPRIITTALLSILGVVDYGMDVQEAVAMRRFHHQWQPDHISVEPYTPSDVLDALRARGHTIRESERNWSSAEAIVIDPKTGVHFGGSDPRRDGLAKGPFGF